MLRAAREERDLGPPALSIKGLEKREWGIWAEREKAGRKGQEKARRRKADGVRLGTGTRALTSGSESRTGQHLFRTTSSVDSSHPLSSSDPLADAQLLSRTPGIQS